PPGRGTCGGRGPRGEPPARSGPSSVREILSPARGKERLRIVVTSGARMITKSLRSILLLSVLSVAAAAGAQTPEKAQATPPSELTVDESFDPPIAAPAFRAGKGPAVVVDEGHRNVVSLKTYFRPVGRFLGKDGYDVRPGAGSWTADGLAKTRVLVVANAQAPEGSPAGASAFSDAEVAAV